MTKTARDCARSLGITLVEIVGIIRGLTARNFYKSMTSDMDAKIWQDVYHVVYNQFTLYVKFTTDSRGYLLISFKEK